MVNTLLEVGQATLNPIEHIWQAIIQNIPGIIGAIVVIIIGYFIGLLVGHLVHKLLLKWKVDKLIQKNNFSNVLLHIKISKIIKYLIIWGIFVVFLAPAASLIKINVLTEILTKFALWVPQLIFAIILTIVGLILSETVARNIHVSKDHKMSKIISEIIQTVIIIVILNVALKQIGVQVQFIETILLIILGGVALAFAIAVGIGLSGSIKQYANKIMDVYTTKKEVKKKK
jgi:small-conductance mechanosensitive channel